MSHAIFDYLPVDKILDALNKAPGNEVESDKLSSPESSAALAANTFGLFLDRPGDLPVIPETEACGWPANFVGIEQCARFPWSGGHHPWLDAFVETRTHIIGIESKRYEPFRNKKTGSFSEAYWRPVWGEEMEAFERMRDRIKEEAISFKHLDAAQLIKHAFGLRTEGKRRGKPPVLVYLYAEPKAWPDGRLIDSGAIDLHAVEAQTFASDVEGAEVEFRICTYADLLSALSSSPLSDVKAHSEKIQEAFQP
jgi:hypothetical protein